MLLLKKTLVVFKPSISVRISRMSLSLLLRLLRPLLLSLLRVCLELPLNLSFGPLHYKMELETLSTLLCNGIWFKDQFRTLILTLTQSDLVTSLLTLDLMVFLL